MRLAFFIAILLSSVLAARALGQQFRIETQIYFDGQSQSATENTTLFSDGLVFDLQTKGPQTHEVTILAPNRRQIVVLDQTRQVKLQLDDIHLIKMGDLMKKQMANNKAASFLVNERFEETLNVESGTASLSSPTIKYSIKGRRPADVRMLPIYTQFIDYFTRMKFSDPHAFPPFPRLRLNETLAKLGWLPDEITVDIDSNPLLKQGFKAISKHTLISSLSDKDRDTIVRLKSMWLNYQLVTLDDYRGLGKRNEKAAAVASKLGDH